MFCYCFKTMCSAQKHTVEQIPYFIHVDLKVGNLEQNKQTKNKNMGQLNFVEERRKNCNNTNKEYKGCLLFKCAK